MQKYYNSKVVLKKRSNFVGIFVDDSKLMKIFKILLVALVAMIGLGSCSKDCDHDFIEHDYTAELVGTWSVIGPDGAQALVIKADGTMEFTGVYDGEYFESIARYEVVNNRITLTWDDGTKDEGRLNVVEGSSFSIILDEETGAGYYFTYCHEDFSDKIIGSWLTQTDETSEIWSYHEDGTSDCTAYYYHLDEHEQFETFVTGTYKLVGDILFETVEYGEGMALSFGSRISYAPGGSPFGDVLTNTSLDMNGDEVVETAVSVVRVKPSIHLAGKKYGYSSCNVTNVKGADLDMEFMGYKFNFAKMDGNGLDKMLNALLFSIEFPDANQLNYSYFSETFNAPVEVDGNKMTVKMSGRVPTLKDVTFYAFQSTDCSQMHLCMDAAAFVNFYTNMQAMLMDAQDEQFDITDADSVNAIYNTIGNAVETIKLTIEMTKAAE